MEKKYDYFDLEQVHFRWKRAEGGYYWDNEAAIQEERSSLIKALTYDRALEAFKGWSEFAKKTMEKTRERFPDIKNEQREDKINKLFKWGPFLIESPKSTGLIDTDPLKESNLFLKFAALEPEPESIKNFADEYGLLTRGFFLRTPAYSYPKGEDKSKPWRHGGCLTLDEDSSKLKTFGIVQGEPFAFWRYAIAHIKAATTIWEMLGNEDLAALEPMIFWDSEEDSVRVMVPLVFKNYSMVHPIDVASWDYRPAVFERLRRGDVVKPAKLALQEIINKNLWSLNVNPTLTLDDEGGLAPYFYPQTLLAAMWFQLFQAVIGEKKYKRCELCGLWEDVTDRTAKWKKHPECANRDRVKRSRENKGKNNPKPPRN